MLFGQPLVYITKGLGVGLEIKVLVLILVLKKSLVYITDIATLPFESAWICISI